MNTANSLASRVARLRTLRAESTTHGIPTARPLPGEWPRGCQAFAASYAQARLWFLQQLEPGLTAYHLPLLWRLQGELDVRALEQALAALIERHPTLRTAFQLQGNEVLQIIHPPGDVTLLVEPLGDRDTDQVIEGWLEQERSTPFDLASGVLLRSRLLRVAPEKHLLLINHHHIASDGWSRSVLARDLVELYNALHSRRPPQLPPLTVHYQDFAAWQQQRLGGPRLQELKEYWISQLRELDPLVLPSDQPRPAVPSHRGGRVTFQIEAEILEPFEELCRKGGATLQMGLLAAVALLLHRYSRQNDFAIGVPIWSRNNPALESLIGFFINTLPIRTQFEAEQSFRQLLAQIKDTSLAAYDRQELPFEQIVQALMMERDTSRNPFYQVMLQLTEISYPSLENLDGLKAELITASTSSLFDLAFSFHRIARQGLRGFIIYASDLFSVDRIDRLAAHLLVLLKSIVKSPDARIASHSLLTDSEEEQIVNWSAAVSAPDGGERNSNQSIDDHDLRAGKTSSTQQSAVTKKIEDLAHLYPDNTALSDGVRRLSYKKLLELTDTLSRHIATLCTPSDYVVILLADPRLEAILCMVSCLFACKAFVVIDSRLPVNRIRNILSEIGHAPIISTKALHSSTVRKDLTERTTLYLSLSEDSELRIETETLGEAYGQTNSLVDNSLVDNSIAYIIFTSGSTGKPKGVLIDRTALDTFSNWATHEFNITSVDRVLQFSSLTFDACIEEIFPALSAGAAIVCCNEEATGSTKGFLNFLEEYKITVASLPTAFWAGLVRECAQSNFIIPHDLRLLIVGGEAMHLHHLRLWEPLQANHTRLLNTYGPTETTVEVACQDLSDSWRFQSRVPLGRPIPHARAWILEPNGLPCPIGIPGELHIGGPTLAHGYLNNPGLTADRFIPDPFCADPTARLYKSGDLASWNPDGTLAFHGRIDQQIKLRGFRIEPGEIEANLLAHPAVAQAVVVLRSDDPSNPRLIGYWVREARSMASAEGLRGFLAERLPDFMVPAALVELEALPLTSNGKVDRRALPAPSFAGDRERRVEPTTELERRLHGIWAEVLGHGEFGIEANFFELGGHSLSAASLSARIEQKLGRRLPISVLFQAPTILQLARWLENEGLPAGNGFRSLVTLQSGGEDPPLFVVHGGQGTVYIHLHLARCLAPDRPVYGLQAVGFDGSEPRHSSVEEMAAHYADEILRFQPRGPYHLLGYSGGGWYAWAVAAELRRRGGSLGLVGMVDTGGTADLHRRLRLQQLLLRKVHGLPVRARRWILSGSGDWRTVLRKKWSALRFIGWTLLRPRGQKAPQVADPDALPRPTQPLRGDYFIQLHTYYRPPRLPVRTDIFAAVSSGNSHRRLWNFYSRGRAHFHPCLDQHTDFFRAEQMPDVAEALTTVLRQIEAPISS
ncbi:MAG: amino acid adenylation domain-containing protein [Cyanobium sp. CZS 25K]|nr:amino acid adenylation domain-containing protein [Cyanobium sp. CZS25K]